MNTWNFDPAHCSVQFSVKHFGVSWVQGRFAVVRGRIEFDPERPMSGSVNVEIEASSISTNNESRDNHLRSKDFFDVADNPLITFASRRVEKEGERFKVEGDLTMKGVAKPVVLDVTYLGAHEISAGSESEMRAGFTATTEVNRHDFGISWDAPAGPGISTVGGEVEISINIEAVRT